MSTTNVIAIFDIGKTNKKFFLLDESYTILLERSAPFKETTDEDGDACDDITLLKEWVLDTLTAALQWEGFRISAVNFTTYGASLVHINENGEVLTPLYSYLKKYPDAIQQSLYEKYGGAGKISCQTASPVLGSLNSGLQLYRIKQERPELYESIHYALHLPQYISYIVSGRACSDITSIGCHTQLWDFTTDNYHQWVKEEGIELKLAPVCASNSVTEVTFNNVRLKVGTGLHDSSAALIPYLAVFKEPFILLSTGTWCISLNPFNKTSLTPEELEKDCLCYMEYKGQPVKASRLFAGHEHEQQVKRLAAHFNKRPEFYKTVKYDAAINSSLQEKYDSTESAREKPENLQVSRFATRNLDGFSNYEEAYHCLLFDIIIQQQYSTQLVMQGSSVTRIFVDGGFSNNNIYMHLLATVFPKMEVYAASVAQATAMGAALAIHQEWNSQMVPANMVKLKYYTAGQLKATS